MAVSAWAAGASYSVGDIRRATTAQVTGLLFKVTSVSGSSPYTSGSSEPSWPTDIGSTVVDNEITWTAISSVYEELSKLNPSSIIELFEMHLDTDLHGTAISSPIRWHDGCNAGVTGNITWAGQPYVRMPLEATGFEYNSTGKLPRPTISVANLDLAITALLVEVNRVTPGNDLLGAEIRRIRTLRRFLDGETAADPNVQWPMEIWYIDRKVSENRDIVSFELTSKLDMPGKKIPCRQLIGNICQWKYRSSECGYTGSNYWDVNDNTETSLANDRCGKRIDSCKLRFGADANGLPFGSFPAAGRSS